MKTKFIFCISLSLLLIGQVQSQEIVGAEYYWDNDPGIGQATAFETTTGSTSFEGEFTAETQGLELGTHNLCTRFLSDDGKWSVVSCKSINICNNFSPTPNFTVDVFNQYILVSDKSERADAVQYLIDDQPINETRNFDRLVSESGIHTITQIATNSCGTDTHTKEFDIRGINRMFPDTTQRSCLLFADLYGRFFENPTFSLVNALGETLVADTIFAANESELKARFWLDENVTVGNYNAVVSYPNEPTDTLINAIEIIEGGTFIPTGTLIGPKNILWNSFTCFNILLENKGTRTEFAVPFVIMVPGYAVTRITRQLRANDVDATVLEEFDKQAFVEIPLIDIGDEFDPDDDVSTSVAFIMIIIPKMRPKEKLLVSLEINPTKLSSFYLAGGFSSPLLAADEIVNFDEFPDLKSSCNFLHPCYNLMLDLIGFVPVAGCVSGAFNLGCSIGNNLRNGGNSMGNLLLDIASVGTCGFSGNGPRTIITEMAGQINRGLGYNSILNPDEVGGGSLWDFLDGSDFNFDPLSPTPFGCDPCNFLPGCGSWPSSFINPKTAVDPNAKTGTIGVKEENYVSIATEFLNYRVDFENVDTATAPAREVFIFDTLQQANLDWTSFEFLDVSFADTTISVNEVRDFHFIRDVDLRPAKNTIVRIEGIVDTLTGVVEVAFKSLDANTLNLTQIVEDGFLNPNVNKPEGQGHISFRIKTKDLEHLSQISNEASIVFDTNEAIITNTWENTIDAEAPTSQVLGIELVDPESSTYELTVEGFDADSGIKGYQLFVSKDNGNYEIYTPRMNFDKARMNLEPNSTYKFICSAVDLVENIEAYPADPLSNPDFVYFTGTVGIDDLTSGNLNLFPNPVSEKLIVTNDFDMSEDVQLTIYNVLGSKVTSRAASSGSMEIDVQHFENGCYLLVLESAKGIRISSEFIVKH